MAEQNPAMLASMRSRPRTGSLFPKRKMPPSVKNDVKPPGVERMHAR